MKKDSVVVGLRERAGAGATAVELLDWLRERKPERASDYWPIGILHHAFVFETNHLRPLVAWGGWGRGGPMTDAGAAALLTPLTSREHDWPQPHGFGRQVREQPFELVGYMTSHSQFAYRSEDGEHFFVVIGVDAMRLRTRYERLEVVEPVGDDRQAIEDFADRPEPFDMRAHYFRLPEGGFVAGGPGRFFTELPGDFRRFHQLEIGEGVEAELPVRFDDGLWIRWATADRRVVLSIPGSGELTFTDVREFQLAHRMRNATALVDAGPEGGLRRYTVTGEGRDCYIIASKVFLRSFR